MPCRELSRSRFRVFSFSKEVFVILLSSVMSLRMAWKPIFLLFSFMMLM